eukprot:gene7763-biopygen21076
MSSSNGGGDPGTRGVGVEGCGPIGPGSNASAGPKRISAEGGGTQPNAWAGAHRLYRGGAGRRCKSGVPIRTTTFLGGATIGSQFGPTAVSVHPGSTFLTNGIAVNKNNGIAVNGKKRHCRFLFAPERSPPGTTPRVHPYNRAPLCVRRVRFASRRELARSVPNKRAMAEFVETGPPPPPPPPCARPAHRRPKGSSPGRKPRLRGLPDRPKAGPADVPKLRSAPGASTFKTCYCTPQLAVQ